MTTPQLAPAWNELVIVAKKGETVHVFSSWKRALSSWLSPDRWKDPSTWPVSAAGLVKMPAGTPWSPQSYGIVAFDFDTKTCWSFNDFQVPGKGYFLDDAGKGVSHFQSPFYKLSANPMERDLLGLAWAAIMNDPTSWKDIHIEAAPMGVVSSLKKALNQSTQPARLSLEELLKDLDTAATPPSQLDAMLSTHRGLIRHAGQELLTMGVTYQAPGWTTRRDWEFDGSVEGALALAEALKDWPGFDHAEWARYVQDKLQDHLSMEDEGTSWTSLAEMLQEAIADDPEIGAELEGVVARLQALASGETETSPISPPGPVPPSPKR